MIPTLWQDWVISIKFFLHVFGSTPHPPNPTTPYKRSCSSPCLHWQMFKIEPFHMSQRFVAWLMTFCYIILLFSSKEVFIFICVRFEVFFCLFIDLFIYSSPVCSSSRFLTQRSLRGHQHSCLTPRNTGPLPLAALQWLSSRRRSPLPQAAPSGYFLRRTAVLILRPAMPCCAPEGVPALLLLDLLVHRFKQVHFKKSWGKKPFTTLLLVQTKID